MTITMKRVVAGACISVVMFAAALTWYARSGSRASDVGDKNGQTSQTDVTVRNGHIESRILFMGDMFWGRAVNKWSQASTLKEAYPFSRLNEFNRGAYDAWIANLECPSVPGVNQPYSLEVRLLLFNCPSAYLPEAAKWFTAFSLANNHTANQGGQPGIAATRQALAAQNIQYFGHYDPNILSDVCEIIALPSRLAAGSAEPSKDVVIPMALCGYHGLGTTPTAASLAVMKQYSKYMPVIAYPHMGVEYSATPTAAQENLYHAMIDNGADAVLASHPHWVQPAEVYKGKLIVYSMGNAMFDQGVGETQRGAAIDLTLKTGTVSADTLASWSEIGKRCTAFHDDCLKRIGDAHLQRLPWTFTYAARGVDMSNRITHPADAALTNTILQRLNWAAVHKQLESPSD